jgi:O-antigen ligase
MKNAHGIGIFLVGMLCLTVPNGYAIGFLLLCFGGLLMWLKDRTQLIKDLDRPFVLPLLIYAFGNMLIGLYQAPEIRQLDAYYPFALLTFGIWSLRRAKPNPNFFWAGLALGALGTGGIAAWQALHRGIRAEGFDNAIQFGNTALLMGMLCFVHTLNTCRLLPAAASPNRRALAFNGLLWFGGLGGIAASLLSQTRGGWVAVPLVIIVAWRQLAPPGRLSRMYFALLFLIFASIATVVMQQRAFTQRWINANNEVQSYVASGVQTTSVGARLAMWTYSLEQIQTHPWIGIGEEGWIASRDAAIRSKRLSPAIAEFNHVHNEFLDVTLKRGVVGLGLLLAMYILPSIYFLRFTKGYGVEVTSLAMAGLIIPISYIAFGLTQVFLGHNSGRMVLVSLWMTVAALLFNAVEKECELMSAKH